MVKPDGVDARPTPTRVPLILVVDGDIAIRRYLRWNLRSEGYRVRDFPRLEDVLDLIAQAIPDLVILDLDSPVRSGEEIIRALRETSSVPIIGISLATDEEHMIAALRNGADDYIVKPFSLAEMLARAQSAIRRAAYQHGKQLLFISGDLEVDLVRRRVWSRGREVRFTAKPYEVLRKLVDNAGKVVSHRDILKAVWGPERMDRLPYLRIAIQKIRQEIEIDPARPIHITTETRVGYRLHKERRNTARPRRSR